MTSAAALTEYLEYRFGVRSPAASSLHWSPRPIQPSLPHTAATYAAVLRADVAVGALQLGTALSGPQGQLIATAVKAMSPPLARPFEQLLIEALIAVAAEQTDRRRQGVMLVAAGAAALGIAAVLLADR